VGKRGPRGKSGERRSLLTHYTPIHVHHWLLESTELMKIDWSIPDIAVREKQILNWNLLKGSA